MMDEWDILKHRMENSYEFPTRQRDFLGYDPKPTLTERYKLKELLRAANSRFNDVQKLLRILEEKENQRKNISGSQEIELTSSFEALFFWENELEKELASYSQKVPVETEFGPRISVMRKKIRVLLKRNSCVMNNGKESHSIPKSQGV